MAVQVVVAPIVNWLFGTAVTGLLGGREGTRWEKNRLFGPAFQELAIQRGLIDPNTPNLPWQRPAGALGPTAGPVNTPPAVIPAPPPLFYPPSTTVYYPPPPPPPPPGGSGSSGIPPRPPPPPATPPINPNAPVGPAFPSMWPYVIGQVAGQPILEAILRANNVLMGVFDTATKPPRPIPKGPPRRRSAPTERPPPGNPFPPQGPPVTVVVNMPATPKEPPKEDRMGGLGDIYVNPRRLPIPAPPAPTVSPWVKYASLGLPLLSSLLNIGGSPGRARRRDPLTQPQNPFGPQGLTSSYVSVQSSGAFGGSGAVGSMTCECKAPRKKARKKKRTVCYSGTFIERRDGTRKTKKRKVQCL